MNINPLSWLRVSVVTIANTKFIGRPARALFKLIGICSGCGMRRIKGVPTCEEALQQPSDDQLGTMLNAWRSDERRNILADIARCLPDLHISA